MSEARSDKPGVPERERVVLKLGQDILLLYQQIKFASGVDGCTRAHSVT